MSIKYIIKTPNTPGYPYWRAANPVDTVLFNTSEEAQDTIERLKGIYPQEADEAEVVAYDTLVCVWTDYEQSCGLGLEKIAGAYLINRVDRLRCPGCGRLVREVKG